MCIRDSLYTVEAYATFRVQVKAGRFAGECLFCMPVEAIEQYAAAIKHVIADLQGKVMLRDYDSDAYLELGFQDDRRFVVRGQLGGSHESNVLKFAFPADQTILFGLRADLLQY